MLAESAILLANVLLLESVLLLENAPVFFEGLEMVASFH
jgi:hypothetical protein